MGFDPASLALIGSLVAGGVTAYTASQNKPPKPKVIAPAAIAAGGEDVAKKVRKYKPAQLFKDEELRLGMTGKLGM